ncbi:hypothetical protein PUNSTDRAFT_145264, partial [Punctularia strigosozonata HHB-11173 SS5]|uniref:uncharacterized protein n=1 Tax=Punctularia strigosozonata (strain HHB-11173) TaxID=741275 RepID=UPI00044168D5
MRTSALIAFVVVAVISVSAAPIPKSQAQARSPGLAGIALKVGEEAGPEILNLGEDVFHHFFGSSDDSSQTQPAVSADPTAAASASRRMVGVRSPSLFNLGEDVVKDVAPSLIKAVPEIVHLGDDVFNHFAGSSSDDQSSAAATSATASVLRSRQVHPIGPLPRALLLGPGIKLPFGLPLGPGLEIPNLTPPSPGVPPFRALHRQP